MADGFHLDRASLLGRADAPEDIPDPASDPAATDLGAPEAPSRPGGADPEGPGGRATVLPASRLVATRALDRERSGPALATIYVSGRGGGLRRLIGSAHRHVIGVRRDPQMGFAQPTEGIAEGPAMMRCATDPDIGWYQMQPFRIELVVDGRLQSYIADLVYVRFDGSVWVREVKRSEADLADLEYAAKLEAVRRVLAGLGWNFAPWTLEEIQGTAARQVNAGTIYYDRAATLDELLPRFERFAAETAETTFRELVDALDPANPFRARAAVHRLIMRGRVWADLDQLLEDWSPVRLRAAVPKPARPYA